MKRKIALIITAVVMLAVTIIGGTMASFQAETSLNQKISTTAVGIELQQKKNGEVTAFTDGKIAYEGMPGDVINAEMSVRNTENKAVYVRVAVSKYWADPKTGKKLFEGISGKDTNGKELKGELDSKEIQVTPGNQEVWYSYAGDEYGEVTYYYYLKPLGANEPTQNFMSEYSILKNSRNSNAYQGLQACLEFSADAIQTTGAKDAILAEWGMKAEFDADGNITNITEQ